jgi:transcriptional regulator with XRE-family HTH domain
MKLAKKLNAPKPARIGAVAKELGISASMIRAWERLGLRFSASPEAGGHRTYTPEDINVLKRAINMRRVRGLNALAILEELQRDGVLETQEDTTAVRSRSIGKRLRMLRLQRKLSLAEVARATGASVGFLSNLERSQTGASIGMMHRLAHFYGSNMLDFFNRAESPGPLVKAADRQSLHGSPGVRMDLLAWGDLVMEPHLFHIEGGSGSEDTYAHEGQEFLFVVAGQLKITLAETVYTLRKGDSFYFESKIVHRWVNPGKSVAVVLWVNTPPTF